MSKSPGLFSPAPRRRLRMGALLLGGMAFGTLFAAWSVRREDHRMRAELLQRAFLVAQSIPLDQLMALEGGPADESKPEYHRLKAQLMAAQQIDPSWKWIYLMGRTPEGTVFFRLDSESYDAPDASPPGQTYEEASPTLQRVFDTRQSATEGPIPDRWGVWVSAFVPLAAPGTDRRTTVLGIDIEAARWRSRTIREALVPALFTASLLLILSTAYRLRRRKDKAPGPGRRPWRQRESVLTAATGLTLTLTVVWLARSFEVRHMKEVFESLAHLKSGSIFDAFQSLRNAELEGLARFIENSEEVTSGEFHHYAEHLGRKPEVMAWAWAPAVKEEDRDAFERDFLVPTAPGLRIWEDDAEGRRIPAAGRSIHYPLRHLEPAEAGATLGISPGYDLGAIDHVRATLEEATRHDLAFATDFLPMKPRDGPPANILIFRAARETGPARALKGFAIAVVDPNAFLQGILKAQPNGNPLVSIDLLQLRTDGPPERLAAAAEPEARDVPIGSWREPMSLTRPILAFGRTYAVSARPTETMIALHSTHLSWMVLLAGLSITLASAIVIGFVSHRREDTERLVDERTFELASSMRRYDQLARQSRTITWETDADGLYIDLSPVVEDVLGYRPGDLIGRTRFYDLHPAEGREEFRATALEDYARRRPFLDVPNPMVAASGEIVWVSSSGMPLLNPDGSLRGYQGTDKDITERKRAEEVVAFLSRQNKEAAERYATLISASNTGAWEYHDDTAYMWASPEYFAMLGLDPARFDLTSGRPNIDEIWLDLLHPEDKESAQRYFIDYIQHPAGTCQQTYRMRHADGHWVWILSRGRALRDAQDRPTAVVVGTHIDISETKRAEQYREMGVKTLQILNEPGDLNDLLARLVAMLKESTGFDAVGLRLQSGDAFPYVVQQGFTCDFTVAENDLLARGPEGQVLPDAEGRARLRCACGLVLSGNTDPARPLFTAGGSCWTNDSTRLLDLPPGEDPRLMPRNRCIQEGYASLALVPVRIQNQIVGLLQFNDRRKDRFSLETLQILESLAAHVGEALQRKRAEQDYRTLFHEMLEGFAVHEIVCDAQGRPADYRFLAMNPAFERLTGLKARDLVGKTALEVLPQTEHEWIEIYGRVALTGEPALFQRYAAALGKHFEVTAFRPAPNQFACIFSDVTDRRRAEDELRESRRQYAALMANLPGMAYRCQGDRAWTMSFVSEGCLDLTGYAPDELVGNKTVSLNDLVCAPHRERLWEKWRKAIQTRGKLEDEYEIATRGGEVKWVWEQGEGVYAEDGRLLALEGFISDVTARKRAEAERERLTRAIEQSGETIVITDAAGVILYVNPAFTRTSGYAREEALGRNPRLFRSGLHDPSFYRQMWETLNAGGTWEGQLVNKSKDGTLYTEQATISPVRDADGRVAHFVAVKRDITSQLRDQTEKEDLQTQLLQAQKMESIGRLAGGVAHDFNNMLQAILGYAEMALEQVDPGLPLHMDIKEIQKAARRSALLTRQLQAFARKQAIAPKVMDLRKALEGMSGMLRRLIGEEIALEWKTEADLGLVRIDPGQLDQIATNLCINARDAIGTSGRILIETRNVELDHAAHGMHGEIEPGPYVVLSVADDGCGMEKGVLDHIFEPFFTTKKTGKGTGLGLATVYGIVKQNQGGIRVQSKPGLGSTFQVFLPRHFGEAPPSEGGGDSEEPASRGNETILLVEDEQTILVAATRMLESMGYRVLATDSPEEALRLAGKHEGQIQMLLTDVIMPEMNGPDLVRKLLASQPRIACLYMSGYTANLLAEQGVNEDSSNFIQKPFSRGSLARKVRSVLDGS